MQSISWLEGGRACGGANFWWRFDDGKGADKQNPMRNRDHHLMEKVVQSQILLLPRHGLRIKAPHGITIGQIHPHGLLSLAAVSRKAVLRGKSSGTQLQELYCLCICLSCDTAGFAHQWASAIRVQGPRHGNSRSACFGFSISAPTS